MLKCLVTRTFTVVFIRGKNWKHLNFPSERTGEGSLSLSQGIFPTQGLNPGLPHCGQEAGCRGREAGSGNGYRNGDTEADRRFLIPFAATAPGWE